ncbi:hypothetical protein D3C87_1417880 [compost metagenome]
MDDQRFGKLFLHPRQKTVAQRRMTAGNGKKTARLVADQKIPVTVQDGQIGIERRMIDRRNIGKRSRHDGAIREMRAVKSETYSL